MARSRSRRILVSIAAGVFVLAAGPSAQAGTPGNDRIEDAVLVTTAPLTYEQDTSGATASGPRFCGNNSSVFFRFVPATGARYQVDTIGSDYDTVLSVFTGRGRSVEAVQCNDDRFGYASAVRFRGKAGIEYYIMVSTCCGSGENDEGGFLSLTFGVVDDAPLVADIDIQGGSTDPLTGVATLSGIMSCSDRSIVYMDGVVRQVRNQIFLARAYFSFGVVCTPDGDHSWTFQLESETSVVFGPGQASIRYFSKGATDGFRDTVMLPMADEVIVLT